MVYEHYSKMPALYAASEAHLGLNTPALLCLGSHIILILIYIALTIVASHHYEHRFNLPFTTSGELWFSLTISVVSQAFGTVYLAVLVLLTQRVALAHDFHTRQSLTAIHDKLSAWLGLGSSLGVLGNQIVRPAAISGIIIIALYLGGVTVLHIVIPASFAVNVYEAPHVVNLPTQLARPSDVSLDSSFYDILSVYGQFTTIGLQGNMIYDVIPAVSSAFGETTVNATTFTANCGSVPNATEVQFQRYDTSTNLWHFDIGYGVEVAFGTPTLSRFSTAFPTFIPAAADISPNIEVVASTISIIDSVGAVSTPAVPIHPGVLLSGVDKPISSLQMLACNIETANSTINVSSVTRTPVDTLPVSRNVTWHDWVPAEPPTDPMLLSMAELSSSSPLSSQWQQQGFGYSTLVNLAPSDNLSSSDNAAFTTPSMLDIFLMEDLGVFAPNFSNFVLLSDFQTSIGKAVAAIAWFERNRNSSSPYTDAQSQVQQENLTGEAAIQVNVLRMRLHFNVLPLIAGLVISCLLLALARTQTRNRGGEPIRYDIDRAGLLQLTWLVGDEPHLRHVAEPTEAKLREAGSFEIHLGELLRQKVLHRPNKNDLELATVDGGESRTSMELYF